jgi:hypothetical protein
MRAERDLLRRVNQCLDALPRSHVRVGKRVLPSYLLLGLVGAAAAFLVLLPLTMAAGARLAVSLALAPLLAATFVTWSLVRAALTGTEETVLIEHLLAALGVAWCAARVAGVEPVRYLDLVAVSMSVFLVFGRVGCLVAGCCFGIPADLGVRYPRECGHDQPVRRWPLPLLEAALWAFLAATGAAFTIGGQRPGLALATTLAGYGAARLLIEPLRGDRRPGWRALLRRQALATATFALGVVAYEGGPPSPRMALLDGAGALVLVGLVVARRRWLALERPLDLGALGAALAERGRQLAAGRLGAEVTLIRCGPVTAAVSVAGGDEATGALLTVSLSSHAPLVRAEAVVLLEALVRAIGRPWDEARCLETSGGVYLAQLDLRARGAPP